MNDYQETDDEINNLKKELSSLNDELVKNKYKLQNLQATINWMETSKFWKLRIKLLDIKKKYGRIKFTPKVNKISKIVINLLKHVFQVESVEYQNWIKNNQIRHRDIESARREITDWTDRHTFSIILNISSVEIKYVKKTLDSAIAQIYPYWELYIVAEKLAEPHIRKIIDEYATSDLRIKIIQQDNESISTANNRALALATGEYLAVLAPNDELAIDALFENAKLINERPDADFIYSDEDKIDLRGRRFEPFFKPDWSPELLYSWMYTSHLSIYRTSLVRQLQGFCSEDKGAGDYDLVLRIIEQTRNIYHIPKILYHQRALSDVVNSNNITANDSDLCNRKALENAIARGNFAGHVEATNHPGFYRVRYERLANPQISIIIPSAGRTITTITGSHCLLETCIRSIQQSSTYKKFEIILVDGYDISESILTNIASDNIQLVRCHEPFNFSHRINQGFDRAKGEYILLLNDDVEVITPDWLESMLELAQQDKIGAVGVKLLYPDRTIQHIGTIIPATGPRHIFPGFPEDDPGYFGFSIVNRNYLAVTGACLMMRRDLFAELEGLDEDFPINYNDVDLCLRAYQAGYRNVVAPHVRLIHYESATREAVVQPEEINYFWFKWGEYLRSIGGDPYYNPNFCQKSADFKLRSRSKHPTIDR